jgi:hypothetical protein
MAILEVRGATGGGGHIDDEERRLLFALSYLVHDWPPALRDASTEEDHDELLRRFWQAREWPDGAAQWFRSRLEFLGVDLDALKLRGP